MLSLYCGDGFVAEELAQEALVRCCRHWSKVRTMESREAWLHRVAINLAKSSFRRRGAEKRAKDRLPLLEQTSPGPDPDRVALREAIALLPHRQKTALIYRFYADLSVHETAELMDCPDGTVKTLTRKGLAALRLQPGITDLKEVHDAG